MRRFFLPAILIAAFLAALLPGPTLHAQETPPVYTFQECETVEEARLRDELNGIAQFVFAAEQNKLDIAGMVDLAWFEQNVDAVVDVQVDTAVDRVRSEEDYWSRFLSGWSADKAEELTTKVANYAFGSDPFRQEIDALSATIADELAKEIGAMTARSASSALLCVQEFIGDTFSETMITVFQEDIEQKVADADVGQETEADFSVILDTHTKTLAGVGVIIASQIAKSLAKKVAQRVAGKVAGRILGKAATTVIPLAGWIIGGGLIIWDLIEAGEGSLPQIRESLKGPEVKAAIRAQVAEVVETELGVEMPELARSVSNDIYAEWLDFRMKFSRVLDLAETNPRFQTLLNNTTADQVQKLASLVAVVDAALTPEQIDEEINSGVFERIFYLPDLSFEILRATGDPQSVVAWANLAGESIAGVAETELYKIATPEDFADRQALEAVLALGDAGAIRTLMELNQLEREILLGLPGEQLRQAVIAFNPDDLRWLASYITQLEPQERNRLVSQLLREPALMPKLKFEDIRRAMVESDNMDETLAFLSEPAEAASNPVQTVTGVIEDTQRLMGGEVPWQLFWRKYATRQNALYLGAGLLLLFLLWRFFFRRGSGVNVTVNIPENRDRR
ncbi:MAG: hypothetical protein WBO46_10490 [Caldilineaceae bacterium]